MHRILERIDGAASTIVPLLYLGGLMLATVAYFSGISLNFGAAVGVALAAACELHSFLQQRRFRASWSAFRRSAHDDSRRGALLTDLRTQGAVLGVLLAFSTFCSVSFTAETWHPTDGALPAAVQIGLRGSIIPTLFFLAGFLVPLSLDAGEVLQRASGDMLHKTVKAVTAQWNVRIDQAKREGRDLAAVAVALMIDSGDQDGARRIQLISDGLAGTAQPLRLIEPETQLTSSNETALELDAPVIELASIESAEARVYAVLRSRPKASIKTIASMADVAESTASKYRRLYFQQAVV